MKIFRSLEQITPETFQHGTVVAIGKFDGVHLGHLTLLNAASELAIAKHLEPVVLTFTNHPLSFLRPDMCPEPLMSPEQRLDQIAANRIKACVMLPFDAALSTLGAEEFITTVLHERLRARLVCVGDDFRFGHRGLGTPDTLKALSNELGYSVDVISQVDDPELGRVSSSRIRAAMVQGDVSTAARLIGRNATVRGTVVHGDARGRDLGFPTANIGGTVEGMIPADGVYAGWATVNGNRYQAAISVGVNLTFDPAGEPRVEAFLLDFSGDIYGQNITVEFVERLRGMVAFPGIEALVERMHEDIRITRTLLI